MSKNILIIDDEIEMLNSLAKILARKADYKLSLMLNPVEAIDLLNSTKFDLVITDLKMKECSGLDVLRGVNKYSPGTKVIIISGYGTIEASVEAMREGSFDFLEKPFTSEKLFDSITRALSHAEKPKRNQIEIETEEVEGIVYKSFKMAEVVKLVKKIAVGEMNILITGESGTGKELIARAIHNLGKGKTNPFVPINCGALPEHLFESELFGHERGAFTGAVKTKPGLLEFANHGTFFFDEIGDMSLNLQIKLLRMLEERKTHRIGAQKEINIDVRIIAATNKDLQREVENKNFREDLYYRLNTFAIEMPPLRERKEDIIPLANHFLAELRTRLDKSEVRFSSEAEEILSNYSWPGNVRELQNIISRAYFLCAGKIIEKSDLPLPTSNRTVSLDNHIINLPFKDAKELVLEKFEVEYLTKHLKNNQGNISKTAEACGLDRRSIHRLINKYNIFYEDSDN